MNVIGCLICFGFQVSSIGGQGAENTSMDLTQESWSVYSLCGNELMPLAAQCPCPLHCALVFVRNICCVTAALLVPVFHRPGLYGIPLIGSGGRNHLLRKYLERR